MSEILQIISRRKKKITVLKVLRTLGTELRKNVVLPKQIYRKLIY